MELTEENAVKQVFDIKRLRKSQRPKRSKLYIYKADIILLRTNNASFDDIALWLRKNKKTKVSRQSVQYFYNKHCLNVEG